MTKDYLGEAHLVDLSDDDLKELLGGTYHALKNLDEAKKNDPEIERMQKNLQEYRALKYDDGIKQLKARLKAARTLALARGITWRHPDEA